LNAKIGINSETNNLKLFPPLRYLVPDKKEVCTTKLITRLTFHVGLLSDASSRDKSYW